jgi:hypothetical protein
MTILNLIEPGISLCGVIVEFSLKKADPRARGDFARAIRAEGVHHNDIVAPQTGVQTLRQIGFFVPCQDQDGYG